MWIVGANNEIGRGGGILSLQQGWRLAKEWYSDRLSPAWQPKSASEAQAAFARIGLKGEFWKLSV